MVKKLFSLIKDLFKLSHIRDHSDQDRKVLECFFGGQKDFVLRKD